jgi:hypothetical protein
MQMHRHLIYWVRAEFVSDALSRLAPSLEGYLIRLYFYSEVADKLLRRLICEIREEPVLASSDDDLPPSVFEFFKKARDHAEFAFWQASAWVIAGYDTLVRETI